MRGRKAQHLQLYQSLPNFFCRDAAHVCFSTKTVQGSQEATSPPPSSPSHTETADRLPVWCMRNGIYLTAFGICISPMTSEAEHLFIFLATEVSSFVNCLLIPLTHFKKVIICVSFVCPHFQPTSARSSQSGLSFMALLCSKLPSALSRICTTDHLAQWP